MCCRTHRTSFILPTARRGSSLRSADGADGFCAECHVIQTNAARGAARCNTATRVMGISGLLPLLKDIQVSVAVIVSLNSGGDPR